MNAALRDCCHAAFGDWGGRAREERKKERQTMRSWRRHHVDKKLELRRQQHFTGVGSKNVTR